MPRRTSAATSRRRERSRCRRTRWRCWRRSARTQALRSCTSGTRAWKTIGKAIKALHRELDARTPNLALVRAQTATMIADCRAKIVRLVPGRAPAPTSARPAQSRKSGRTRRISPRKAEATSSAPRKRSTPPPTPATWTRSRRATRDLGKHLQGLPRQVSARRCTTEPRFDGLTQPVWDLPVRLVHWLLAGADRLQLVVGPQPPHRLAHLVGLRDPDAC